MGLAVLSQQPGNHTLAISTGGGQTTVPDGEAGTGCPWAAPSCSRASNPSGTSDLPWGGWPGAATVRLVSLQQKFMAAGGQCEGWALTARVLCVRRLSRGGKGC